MWDLESHILSTGDAKATLPEYRTHYTNAVKAKCVE